MKYQGLTEIEAQKILIQTGPNEFPLPRKSFILNSLLKTLLEPMIIILLLACLIYFLLGEFRDFLILTISALVIFIINIYQNYKTEEALKKLKSLSRANVEVIRDGVNKIIDSKFLVEGDYVIINEGDRIPADLVILQSSNLLIDESIITGESLPIQKKNFFETKEKNFNDIHTAFSGTLVNSGWLVGIVHKTGVRTKIGEIGRKLEIIDDEEPQVKKEINSIVFNLAILGLITCLFIFGYNFLLTSNLAESILKSVALAIALVPEELPIVLTIFLALSSVRLTQKNLIVKNKAIIETLGATNIICVDKTGTITQNSLKLKKLIINNKTYETNDLNLNENIKEVVSAAFLATYFNSKDSSDLEIKNLFEKIDLETPKMETLAEKVIDRKFVYSKKYLYRKQYLTYTKGAYEQISKICRIPEEYEDYYLSQIEELSNIGYRIIAVASKKEQKITGNKKFDLLGLLAFQDEIREGVGEYINLCQNNNIRVCMITGDYKNTAVYFAKQIGLNNPESVITGDDLEKWDIEKLKNKISSTNIFARVTPQQKFKIVTLLKSSKNIVAMTGDGVNDVLALKSANVGISIGKGGSDIAREASDLILMENNFKNIVEAVIEGRRVYTNLAVTGRYLYSFHLPIVLIAIFNILFQIPQLLWPVHIALLEFIIDPFSTLVFESIPAKKDLLKEKPRRGKFKLIQNLNLKLGTFYGISMFLLIFIPFYFMYLNNFTTYKETSLVNILGLNMVLIWLNFSSHQTTKELIQNKRFSLPFLLLFLVLVLSVIYFNLSIEAVLIILISNLLFILLGFTTKMGSYKES